MPTMNLITDKACFGVSLRNACLAIAIYFLLSMIVGVIIRPSYLGSGTTLFGFIISLLGNLGLLFGALWNNKWLVLTWLVYALLFFIGWPIAIFGVIFNYGDYRAMAMFDNIFLVLLEYFIILVVFAYCTHLVYSYFHQLRNTQSSPVHAVVV